MEQLYSSSYLPISHLQLADRDDVKDAVKDKKDGTKMDQDGPRWTKMEQEFAYLGKPANGR